MPLEGAGFAFVSPVWVFALARIGLVAMVFDVARIDRVFLLTMVGLGLVLCVRFLAVSIVRFIRVSIIREMGLPCGSFYGDGIDIRRDCGDCLMRSLGNGSV